MRWLILLLVLSACSNQWFCKRCFNGSSVKTDTAKVSNRVITPGEEANALFKKSDRPINWDSLRSANPEMFPESPPCPDLPPIMEVKNGKASAIIKQTDKGLEAQIKCDPDTVEIEVKVPFVTEIETGLAYWKAGALIVLALVVGAGIMRLFR